MQRKIDQFHQYHPQDYVIPGIVQHLGLVSEVASSSICGGERIKG